MVVTVTPPGLQTEPIALGAATAHRAARGPTQAFSHLRRVQEIPRGVTLLR